MKYLDIIVRTIILIIFLAEIFYIPKVMIPDIIEAFRKVFGKENNNITETQQKNIDIRV